jgi:hypothetical protein
MSCRIRAAHRTFAEKRFETNRLTADNTAYCGYGAMFRPMPVGVRTRPIKDGVAEGANSGLGQCGNITGKTFAGTPIAVQPAGTSLITNEFAEIVAPLPTVTAPMMLALHPM